MNKENYRKMQNIGQEGQDRVEAFLVQNGYQIVTKNYNARFGELDLVATKGEVMCFVEVKTRTKRHFPTSMVVTKSKQLKIEKAAKIFISKYDIEPMVFRFDVAIVELDRDPEGSVQYIPNAFYGGAFRR